MYTYHNRACKTMTEQIINQNHSIFIFITKKAFQNHAQAALDTSAIDQSADLCLLSA